MPANAADWQVDPFGGIERDGCIWGRGAVDMKDMDAMILACVRDIARTGSVPPRDLVVVFFADEEAGGTKGSHFLVTEHPEVFAGVTEAISEVGGYSVTVTELVGWEHSMKNELILARRNGPGQRAQQQRAAERLTQVLDELGLQILAERFAVPQEPTAL